MTHHTGGMDESEFERWVELLEQRTGVVVPPQRKQFLETNLRLRMRELGMDSYEEYFRERLEGRKGAIEWSVLVDRLTVHETQFFRHPPSYDLLRETVIPDFLLSGRGNIHAWSVGCSTGEEAYSIAMVLDLAIREASHPGSFGVTASDVSRPALSVGRDGVYPISKAREIPAPYQGLYCRPRGKEFTIEDALRRRVAFVLLNLRDVAEHPMSDVDVIFCQNVLIYFSREMRERVVAGLIESLRPGGYLILGPGELTGWRSNSVERVDNQRTLAFRRLDG